MIKVFTTFSGYDSQCLALERLKRDFPNFGYELVGWSEIDKYAIKAHDALFPQARNYGDITKIDWAEVPDFDLFTYSSPCQDFSQAGKQKGGEKGSGTRSSLLWYCEHAIRVKRPKFCLMENVSALVSQKFVGLFNKWQLTLEKLGYHNYAQVLNAKDYGVPQNRDRIFLVSIREDVDLHFYFPNPFKLKKRLVDVLEDDVDEKYYISDTALNGYVEHNKRHIDKGTGFLFQPKDIEEDGGGIAITRYAQMVLCVQQTTILSLRMNSRLIYTLANNIDDIKESSFIDCYNNIIREGIAGAIKTTIDTANMSYVIVKDKRDMNDVVNTNVVGELTEGIWAKREQTRRVYGTDGIAPTLQTCQGGGREPKIEVLGWTRDKNGKVTDRHPVDVANCITSNKGSNTQNYVRETITYRGKEFKEGDGLYLFDSEKFASGGLDGISRTLKAEKADAAVVSGKRIRKLTERECFRLMGCDDADIDKIQSAGISKTQQYKMAGNSIVVDVLYHIFRKMFVETKPEGGTQLELF